MVDTYDEQIGLHSAAFAVAKGRRTKIDLTELELEYLQNEEQKKVYMFLCMTWAIISDCDINSEVIRWVGPPRFILWGVYRVLSVRHYPGEFTYKGFKATSKHEDFESRELSEKRVGEVGYKVFNVLNTPWIGEGMHLMPLSKIDDGMNDIMVQTMDKSRWQLTQVLLENDKGNYFNKDGSVKDGMGVDYLKCTEWELKPTRKGPVPENLNY